MGEAEELIEQRVQELAEDGVEPSFRFIHREEDRPMDAPPPTIPVPVVDLGRLLQPDAGDEADKLRSALQSWGLFQAIGHGMSASFLDEVQNITRSFFRLSMEVKKKSTIKVGEDFADFVEGYGNGNEPLVIENQILDWSDRLYLLVQPEDERKLDLWPKEPGSFTDVLHEYTAKSGVVAKQVLRSMAKVLGLDEDCFVDQFGERDTVIARFNYFPCCPRPDLVFGIKAHSDGSLITTVLPGKDVEGLQVLKDDEWVKIPLVPHALLVILGDEMEIMSNGIFKSPVHRVVANATKDRISVAMFYNLEAEKELKPAEGLIDETRPSLYKMMLAKDYYAVFFQNYVLGKRAIECAKI